MRYFLTCLLLAAVSGAYAQTVPPGLEQAQIIQGWQDDSGTRTAAIHLKLTPEWKTYWRVPGDTGIPPELDFSHSRNVADVEVLWPAPTAFDQDGTRTVGYRDSLTLPLRITPEDPSQAVELDARMSMGLCNDICVPAAVDLRETLSGKGREDTRIAAAIKTIPRQVSGIAECQTQPLSDGTRVTARILLPETAGLSPALFELAHQPMWTSQTVETRDGSELLASVDFVPADSKPFDLDTRDLRITVLAPGGAIQIDGCSRQNP